jgi:hypothetical protein
MKKMEATAVQISENALPIAETKYVEKYDDPKVNRITIVLLGITLYCIALIPVLINYGVRINRLENKCEVYD